MSAVLRGRGDAARALELYLASRRASRALVGILGSAALTWLLLTRTSDPQMIQLIWIVMPLVPAVVIGVSTWSPFGEVEHTASRPLLRMRGVHLGGLLLCAILGLAVANLAAMDPEFRWVLVRNLAGYTGLALIGARAFGPAFGSTFSWVLPLAYGFLVRTVGDEARWAWAGHSTGRDSASVIAIILLAIGLALIVPDARWRHVSEGDVA